MKRGKTHTLVSAYSALFTVAIGLVVFDTYSRRSSVLSHKPAAERDLGDNTVSSVLAAVSRQADALKHYSARSK